MRLGTGKRAVSPLLSSLPRDMTSNAYTVDAFGMQLSLVSSTGEWSGSRRAFCLVGVLATMGCPVVGVLPAGGALRVTAPLVLIVAVLAAFANGEFAALGRTVLRCMVLGFSVAGSTDAGATTFGSTASAALACLAALLPFKTVLSLPLLLSLLLSLHKGDLGVSVLSN